ncbi:hypothetical protein [Streptomyces sp. NBC_00178]|uniref:hypothetical protein n=1 Tax=unclassified Streptomyces TaxID=2593676 RepID=UPI002E2B50ED|nr:hypothetical protein [Streptomyces sp. NBC_00178]
MPASAQLLLSALSKQVPSLMDCDPPAAENSPTPVPPMISELPLAYVSDLTAEAAFADAPLTSEPPLADATPLTSEPPLAAVAPLTSEPTAPGTAGGMESPGV